MRWDMVCHSHGRAVFRHTITVTLAVFIVCLSWQLLKPLMRGSVAQGAVIPAQDHMTASRRTPDLMVAAIVNTHLFGQAPDPGQPGQTVAAPSSLSIGGIVYSTDPKESVATISVDSVFVLCHVGTQLTTGETVTHIGAQEVELSGPAGTEILALNIKPADMDQHVASVDFSSDNTQTHGLPVAAPASLPGFVTQPVMSAKHVTLVTTHFGSLRALRGNPSDHFGNVKPP
jgi:Type II secretion system protein C